MPTDVPTSITPELYTSSHSTKFSPISQVFSTVYQMSMILVENSTPTLPYGYLERVVENSVENFPESAV